MSPSLQVPTLMLVTAALHMLLPLCTWFALRMPRRAGPLLWCGGEALAGLGVVMVSLPGVAPAAVPVAGRVLVLFGGLLVARGLRHDLGEMRPAGRLFGIAAGYAGLLWLASDFDHPVALDLLGRLGTLYAVSAIALAASQVAASEGSRNAAAIAWTYGLQALAVLANLGTRWFAHLDAPGPTAAVLVGASLVGVVVALVAATAYLGLAVERATRNNISLASRTASATQLQKRLEQVVQMDRERTLALLSDSIAHAMTQPLTAALVRVQVAQRSLRAAVPDAVMAGRLAGVTEAVRSTSETVDRVRGFLQRLPQRRSEVNLAGLLQDVVYLLRQEAIRGKATLSLSLAAPYGWVHGEGLQLSHALLQVVRHAMSTAAAGRQREVQVGLDVDATRVRVMVAPATAQMLDSVAQAILQDHGGTLRVEGPKEGRRAAIIDLPRLRLPGEATDAHAA